MTEYQRKKVISKQMDDELDEALSSLAETMYSLSRHIGILLTRRQMMKRMMNNRRK